MFKEERNVKGFRRFWPVVGFVMILCLSLLAYVIAPDVIRWLDRNFPAFTGNELPREQMRLIFTALVFLVLATIGAGLVAVTAPRKPIQVSEKALIKERDEAAKARALQRKRQQKINREFRNMNRQ